MQVAVQRGLLVRVFAVTQVLQLGELAVGLASEQRALRHIARCELGGVERDRRQVVADRAVILADAVERGDRQGELGGIKQLAAGLEFGQHAGVLRRVGQHADILPVLGRRAHHGRSADVDVLDGLLQRAAGLGHGRFKRVEVDHQHVDGGDAVRFKRRHVLRQVAPGEQATVNFRVQRLDAAIEHFRKTGVVGHFGHGQTGVSQQFGGAAGGQQRDAQRVQRLGEFKDAGLVGNGNQGVHGLLC